MPGPAYLTPQDVLAVVEARRTKTAATAEWSAKDRGIQGRGARPLNAQLWAEARRTDDRLHAVRNCLETLTTEALKELQTMMYAGREGGLREWPEADEWDMRAWKRWPQAVKEFKSINEMDRTKIISTISEKAPLEHYLYLAIEGLGLDLGWTTILQWLQAPEQGVDTSEQEDEEY